MSTITLAGDYGLNPYYVTGLASGSVIDARTASWNLSHSDVPDPFRVYSAPNVTITGGSIKGDVSLTGDWRSTYDVNYSAAVKVRWSPNAVIEDWRIDQVWDAITVRDGTTNWLVDDVHLTNVRDDGLDNDHMASGTLRDSLFDGVFVGVSTDSTDAVDGHNNVMTLQNTFIRMQNFSHAGELTHGPPLKTDADYPDHQPSLRFIDSVIAISDVNHGGWGRTKLAWENTVEVQNSYYLNLSDTPFPSNYPLPPGFTILQGQEARDFWEATKAAWLDNHDGTPYADVTPLPGQVGGPLPPPPPSAEVAPEPAPEAAPTDTTTPSPTPAPTESIIEGTRKVDTLTGTAGADVINGFGGEDFIYGKEGNDILTGGTGRDKFVIDTPLGADNVDRIIDFSDGWDRIYLDNAVFTKLGSGSLSSPDRISSSWFDDVANDSNDYILYDEDSGVLSYDADGNGPGAATQIALLTAGADLYYSDIFIV